ncbi:MAG: hypothetical protein ACPGEE_05550 [Opitutales bacterium]
MKTISLVDAKKILTVLPNESNIYLWSLITSFAPVVNFCKQTMFYCALKNADADVSARKLQTPQPSNPN